VQLLYVVGGLNYALLTCKLNFDDLLVDYGYHTTLSSCHQCDDWLLEDDYGFKFWTRNSWIGTSKLLYLEDRQLNFSTTAHW